MRAQTWKVTSLETVAAYGPFSVRRGDYQREDGFARTMHTVDFPDWVNVVPVTTEGEIVLVRQWRPGSETFTWETPGGVMDPGESAVEAGRRELLEETGHEAASLEELGAPFANPAISGNRIHYVLASDVRHVQRPAFDGGGEECETVLVPARDVDALLEDPRFSHALCWGALARARARLKARFGGER